MQFLWSAKVRRPLPHYPIVAVWCSCVEGREAVYANALSLIPEAASRQGRIRLSSA